MQGKGIPAAYATDEEGTVAVADFSTFQPTSLEASIFKQSLSIPVVLRLSGSALAAGQSVVLLSARNILADPGGHQFGLDEFLSVVRKQLPARVRDRLSISTVHGFKGNQSDVVIILDANETSYPLIHPSWSFSRILGESESEIVNESRRLFYVALTRAKHALYILTESGRRSPFLDEISHHTTLTDVSWSSFPQILQDDDWLVVKVGVFGRPIDQIKPLFNGLKADSFRYRDLGNAGGDLTWDRAYRITGLRDGFLIDSPWMVQARAIGTSGVQVHFFDALDKIRARGEIVGGKLLMRSTAGTSTEFDIDRLRKAFA
jgi:DNA helicase-4